MSCDLAVVHIVSVTLRTAYTMWRSRGATRCPHCIRSLPYSSSYVHAPHLLPLSWPQVKGTVTCVTDSVEWDNLCLFLPLHKELKCKKLFLYKIFYWNKRNVKRTSHSLAINATIGVLLTLLVCCTCFLFFYIFR